MISKKHFTKSMATILSTLTFLTAVSPCTFAEKNFNKKTAGPMSTTNKILLAGAAAIGIATVAGGVVYALNIDYTEELLEAIKSNDNKKAKKILDKYCNNINFNLYINDDYDLTLYDMAILWERKEIYDMLIKKCNKKLTKFNYEQCAERYKAAFRNAIDWDNFHMCELLLKYGRNHTSNYNINTEKINTLGDTLLHRAVRSGNIKIVELLLKNGADVNATDIDGYTPLHTVFYIDCERLPCKDKEKNDLLLNLCKLLIDNGADVNATDKNGKKPLDLARTDEIKQLLLGRSKL